MSLTNRANIKLNIVAIFCVMESLNADMSNFRSFSTARKKEPWIEVKKKQIHT